MLRYSSISVTRMVVIEFKFVVASYFGYTKLKQFFITIYFGVTHDFYATDCFLLVI